MTQKLRIRNQQNLCQLYFTISDDHEREKIIYKMNDRKNK